MFAFVEYYFNQLNFKIEKVKACAMLKPKV